MAIYDATYTDEELAERYTGWGHSTWQEGVRLGQKYNVGEMALFHHEACRNDRDLDALEKQAQKI